MMKNLTRVIDKTNIISLKNYNAKLIEISVSENSKTNIGLELKEKCKRNKA